MVLDRIEILLTICTAAIALVAILVAIGLYYLIIILRNVRNITRTADQTTSHIADDISKLRENVKDKGLGWAILGDIVKGFGKRKNGKKTKD
jgi:predicted PurR-regulated permease PerM